MVSFNNPDVSGNTLLKKALIYKLRDEGQLPSLITDVMHIFCDAKIQCDLMLEA